MIRFEVTPRRNVDMWESNSSLGLVWHSKLSRPDNPHWHDISFWSPGFCRHRRRSNTASSSKSSNTLMWTAMDVWRWGMRGCLRIHGVEICWNGVFVREIVWGIQKTWWKKTVSRLDFQGGWCLYLWKWWLCVYTVWFYPVLVICPSSLAKLTVWLYTYICIYVQIGFQVNGVFHDGRGIWNFKDFQGSRGLWVNIS